jgi:hypothetical protein
MFTEKSKTDEGVELLWAYFRMTWAWNPCSHYADGGAERGCDTQRQGNNGLVSFLPPKMRARRAHLWVAAKDTLAKRL